MAYNSVNECELKKLHPLKKVISLLVYSCLAIYVIDNIIVYVSNYISGNSIDIKSNQQELLSVLVIVIILVLWSPSFIRYIKTPLLSVPRISQYIPNNVLKQHINSQNFKGVPESNLPNKCFMESENWYKINGYFIPKFLLYYCYASVSEGNQRVYSVEFRFLTGDSFTIIITGYKDLIIDRVIKQRIEQIRAQYHVEGGEKRNKVIKAFFKQYIEAGNNPFDLITDQEKAKQYVENLYYYIQHNN
ncbi:hypothetical protein [Anaeromicropila herbilytica]|uniref:Uncharacterized protein n=1 Tax=Anaeromicropila herbilytica TaxID=2785025 RepID=A0A7R7EN80_9FIRM|nr:hypothetical protein [Anaeromicropila herbilytica]BCN31965.1 hypothetical protein bsdtb5_32600 [Anaeromicropila herbilytica]